MPNPFGLEAGSTPDAGMADYLVVFHAVPKPHPLFFEYSGNWRPGKGLVEVVAKTKVIEDDESCYQTLKIYDQLKRQLSQVYGAGDVQEYLVHDSIWDGADEFWQSLHSNDRVHATKWDARTGAELDAKINRIYLSVMNGYQHGSSYVFLSYEFEGYEKAELADSYAIGSL